MYTYTIDKTMLLQVLLVGISNDFVLDKGCCNLVSFAINNLHKQQILIVLGDGFEWKKSDITMQITKGDEVKIIIIKCSICKYLSLLLSPTLQPLPVYLLRQLDL